jgi:transaldolase
MKGSGIFYDSADINDFEKWLNTHILGGATTNPVLFEKAGVLDVVGHISRMVELSSNAGQAGLPISVELPDADWPIEQMVELGLKYQERFPNNAVIKVPMKPDEPEKAFEVIYRLGQQGVRINATIGITMGQLVGAAEASRLSKAKGENYISLFWGRRDEAQKQILVAKLAEINKEGMTVDELNRLDQRLLQEIPDAAATLAMTLAYLEKHSLNTRVIIGSVRNVHQIEQAFSIGADIVTIPPKLLGEWMFTQRGMETVDQFNQAYRPVADKIKLID